MKKEASKSQPNIKEVKKEEGTILVSKTVLGQATQNEEKIEIRPFVTNTAAVSCRIDKTINIGNYENIKIGVFVSSPCYNEEIVPTYKRVSKLVHELIEEELKALEE